MKSQKIHTARIKVPEIILDRKIIGKNKIVHFAQKQDVIDVDVFPYISGVFLLKDKFGRELYLKLPKVKTKKLSKNTLRAKDIKDIKDLNEKVKLTWEIHNLNKNESDPHKISSSWKNSFNFREESSEQFGLRPPQLGAIHAISSYLSLKNDCMTVVMPTGTGKTEVMLSTLVYKQCNKILVLVPSAILRKQMLGKFSTLGCLKEIGVIDEKTTNPRVSVIESGMRNMTEVKELIDNSNVIIALSQSLKNFSDEAKKEVALQCSHLFIDEAHHVAAQTWNEIKELFKDKPIVQFTATPFRRDSKRIAGDIIYNYPLGRAQEDGYFKKINLIKLQIFDERKADEEIAKSAIAALNKDLKDKHDHLLMARCGDQTRAGEILEIYKRLAPDHNPELIIHGLPKTKTDKIYANLESRHTKIIVCVNMLGEGYDFPNLKIAALHDVHKSLAPTLQFVGRFTRTSKKVGDATVVINTGDPPVNDEVEDLYSDDTIDWNTLLKEKSESTIQKEIELHDFINNFSGELSKHISLWNLRPAFSTLIFETTCKNWLPNKFTDVMPPNYKYWHALNEKEKILVIVVSKEDSVKWGRYKDIKNHSYELCVIHWSEKHNALFIQCSDYDAFNCSKLAKVICGDSAKVKNGQKVFNIYSGVERALARNVGVKTLGKISYTMHIGVDITTGLSKLDKSQGVLNNIYAWGYENGNRVDKGSSAGKGKIWARGGGPVILWKQWCHEVADKIFDNSIKESEIIKDFLKPQELTSRYPSIPVNVQWSENILSSDEDSTSIFFKDREYKVYEIGMEIVDFTDNGSVVFKIFSETEESVYKIDYTKGKCTYSLVKGNEVRIKRYSGEPISLIDYVDRDPITIFYIDGTFSFNNFHVPTPKLNTFFDKNKLQTIDWSGTNIQIESMGKDGKRNSVQHKVIEMLKDDYEIVFNDDASGEAADIIALRQESDDSFSLHLIHCKFSSEKNPGARVDDFYTLCGQAQKSIRWKHNGMEYLFKHIKRREEEWQKEGLTRFIKGDFGDLNKIKKFSRYATKFNFEVSIVQPGLEKSKISDDIIQLLGSTEDYLLKTSGANFNVFCS